MATHASATELRNMPVDELRKEIDRRRLDVAKARLSIGMRTQKDTAQFRRDKRAFARMCTVLTELKKKPTTSTVSAPARRKTKQASTSA